MYGLQSIFVRCTLCMDCSLYLLGAHYVWIVVYIC